MKCTFSTLPTLGAIDAASRRVRQYGQDTAG
jgi:hypothetical protein